jgi:hypothetical protein
VKEKKEEKKRKNFPRSGSVAFFSTDSPRDKDLSSSSPAFSELYISQSARGAFFSPSLWLVGASFSACLSELISLITAELISENHLEACGTHWRVCGARTSSGSISRRPEAARHVFIKKEAA